MTCRTFLGPARASFDDFVDRAPGGELEVAGGVFKHAYNGNWKLMLENHLDGAHPAWVHASSVAVARNAPDPGKPGEEHYSDIAVRQMRQNGAPDAVWEAIGMWTTPRGHGYMGDYHDDSRLVAGLGNPVFDHYRKRLIEEKGEAEADRILRVTLWNTIVYPNCSFMSQFRQLRIIHPIAVDRSVVYTYSFRMKGAPAPMFRDTVAFANVVNGTGSWVLTDDLEVYERIQHGLSSGAVDWVYIGRGHGRDVDEPNGTRRGATGTSEVFIRAQMRAWLNYMSAVNAEQFLYHEARLLDTQQLEAWLELFTEDATYWVPLERDQKDPLETSSIIHDDRTLLELRVKQARHPRAHARLPLARTVHQVGNVMVLEEDKDEVRVRSTLQLVEFRNEKQRFWGALVEHRLRKANGTFKIAHKRVDLVNSEGELDGIAILF